MVRIKLLIFRGSVTLKISEPKIQAHILGGSRISGKEVHMYKGVWVRFADFISFFLNIP